MRDMIWNAVRSKVSEGMILPWWALVVRAVLYPLEFFYWRMSQQTGYQWQNDTWLINGVTYSGDALRWLAKAQGETYRVTRAGDTVTLERVHNAELRRLRAYAAELESQVIADCMAGGAGGASPLMGAAGDALARRLFDAGWKAAARFCDRDDVVADGVIGFGACPQFEAAFKAAIAAQQGDTK